MSIEKIVNDTIKNSISDFFEGKEVKVGHVLDLIFPRERRIRSLIGGLETSLGTRLWEPLAKAFAHEGGFEVLCEKSYNEKVPVIPEDVRNFTASFLDKKKNDPSLKISEFEESLRRFIQEKNITATAYQKIPKGEGVDIWLKKDECEYLIDIKTNRINAGSGPKFTQNILNWLAYQLLSDTNRQSRCILAFPFNPHIGKDFWAKEGGKALPLIPSEEALVADEVWDMLYGKENTTELIFKEFAKLGEKDFGSQFNSIFEPPAKNITLNKV